MDANGLRMYWRCTGDGLAVFCRPRDLSLADVTGCRTDPASVSQSGTFAGLFVGKSEV